MYQFISKLGNYRLISQTELNTTLLDGPTSSGHTTTKAPVAGFRSVTDVTGAQTATVVFYSRDTEAVKTLLSPSSQTTTATTTTIEVATTTEAGTTATPSTTGNNTPTMPEQTGEGAQTDTISAETLNGLTNRFAILSRGSSEEFDVSELPSVPRDNLFLRENLVFDTAGDIAKKTVSTATTTTPSSPRSDNIEAIKGDEAALAKKKLNNRNHNNNHHLQGDVNCIESISDNNHQPIKPLNTDFGWNGELTFDQNGMDVLELQNNKQKKKKKLVTAKELDQLDGVPNKPNTNEAFPEEDDEKVVKCLYYTLMCCDCSIS